MFVTIFTAIAGTLVYWKTGNLIWLPALCVVAGSMIEARIGSKFLLKAKSSHLQMGLAILAISLAFTVLFKAL